MQTAADKIRKLLALGENSGATENERETAMRQAHKLMLRHNLDRASVEASGAKPAEARGIVRAHFFGRPWARIAAQAAARLMLCEYIYRPHSDAKLVTHMFIGTETNGLAAAELARWLVETISKEGKRRNRTEGDGRNLWYRSFCVGAANAVHSRVEQMIREASTKIEQSEPGTALAIVNLYAAEQAANQVTLRNAFPSTRAGRKGSSRINDGISSGTAFGASIQLNRPSPGAKRLGN